MATVTVDLAFAESGLTITLPQQVAIVVDGVVPGRVRYQRPLESQDTRPSAVETETCTAVFLTPGEALTLAKLIQYSLARLKLAAESHARLTELLPVIQQVASANATMQQARGPG
jgi:hypothetical protein